MFNSLQDAIDYYSAQDAEEQKRVVAALAKKS